MKIYLNIKLIEPFDEKYYKNVIGLSNYELPLIERKKNNFVMNIHIDDKFYIQIKNKLTNLRYIYIRNGQSDVNGINLKEILCEIYYLIELNISYTKINDMMECNLPVIQHIKINHCQLKQFPTRKITKYCQTLDLSNNEISGTFYLEHTSCKFIYLDNNKIMDIFLPYSCHTISMNSNLCKIVELYNPVMKASFSNNLIELFKISKWMEDINITNNKIVKIENLEKCEKLQYLNASYNCIKNIDISFNKLLKKLYLKQNQLDYVDGIEECVNLEVLDLSNNQLEVFEIPINISRVDLSNNPLKLWDWMIIGNQMNNDVSNGLSSNIQNMICNFLINSTISKTNKNTYDKMVNSDNKIKLKKNYNIYLNNILADEFNELNEDILNTIINNENFIINIFYKSNKYIDIQSFCNQNIINKIYLKLDKEQLYDWIKDCKDDNIIKNYRNGIISIY